MKKKIIIICLICFSVYVTAQNNLKSKDSITSFYNEIISTMKAEYLFKDEVDWAQTETELNERLQDYKDFKSSLEEITFLFDKLNATHCSVYFEENFYRDSKEGSTASNFSEQWLKKYATKPKFEVKVLNNQFGYILMPSIILLDNRKVKKIAQSMYDQIYEVKKSKNVKGWIIDLRFNTGGSVTPMLLALYDFLGDNEVWGTLDINKKRTDRVKLSKGKYKYNSKKTSYISLKGELLDKVRVAVITNMATGSSGEVTALAFKGRQNTIFIGEKTYGAMTANVRRNLPFGAFIALTTSYECDRNGEFYEKIFPDIKITGEDNFDDLILDGNIQEGIKYINKK